MTAEPQRAEPLRCDLVMKGGVSSGVVYPPAIAELAEKYRFEQIGGTSAGAIAAAVTAAAEYGRQRQHIESFEVLNELSGDISQPGRLLTLFRSTAPAHLQPLLDTLLPLVSNPDAAEGKPPVDAPAPGRLVAFVGRIAPELLALLPLSKRPGSPSGDTIGSTLRGLIARLPLTNPNAYARGVDAGAVAGVRLGQYAIGIALVLTLLFAIPLWIAQATVAGWVAWALLGVLLVGGGFFVGRMLSQSVGAVGGSLAAASDLARLALHDVPDNMYGLCTGHSETSSAEQPALTDWLDSWLRRVGGPTESGDPLTFADLQQHDVRLQMVTTNLSHGRPYILPFASDLILLFRRADMVKLFPNDIVAYMCKDEHLYPGWSLEELNEELANDSPERFYMLPLSDSLPVLVGMRMSLSFPVLISAMRLYTVSASCPQVGGEYRPRRQDVQENWFSDGGICSNFPIHFFDAWLPTHPTFGINLTALPKQAFAGTADPEPPQPGTVRVKGAESAQDPGSVLPEYVSQITPDAPVAPIPPPITKPSDEDYLRDTLLGVQSKSGEPALTHMLAPSSARVLLPDAEQPVDPLWRPMEGLSRFLWSMFDTAMNYRDTTQLMLPSYKERAVQIRLDGTREGGLNLNMPKETLDKLQEYGHEAGQLLREKFNFERHQWVRFRVLMGELERQLLTMQMPLSADLDDDGRSVYEHLMAIAREAGFPFSDIARPPWVVAADNRLRVLRALIDVWRTADDDGMARGVDITDPLPGGEQRISDLTRVFLALTSAWQQAGLDHQESQRRAQQLLEAIADWPVPEGVASEPPRAAQFFKPVAGSALDLRVTPQL